AALGLTLESRAAGPSAEAAENSVDLCLNHAEEVSGGLNFGQALTFSGPGVKVIFSRDAGGRAAVRVSGRKSQAELEALGEALAQKVVQQYAYHRLVTEMKARNMNVVEEEVEADGTVRLQVRVFQG
ncbi:MAG: DUF1257 domain-containing protein, partial [Candidatus Adiutrix sp.]|nr:DUF1257 domain-containing protein [Candidatus Adiutrix sp.]